MTTSTYPVWGWSRDAAQSPTRNELEALAPVVADHLGLPVQTPEEPAPLPALPADRVTARLPASLVNVASADDLDRARHGLGRSYRDIVRGVRGQLPFVPDVVVRPRDEAGIAAVLDWCAGANVAVVPYAGGTSVVGGVEPAVGAEFSGVLSLDLEQLAGVREVDAMSRAVRVAAGTPGPRLEEELRPHGLTARFFPQSFERSTVGRGGAPRPPGHFSARLTHIDDIVESVRAVTPAGVWESRRLPGSGAGPSPDRMLLGSEGTLGVITSAWVRVQPRPEHRAGRTVRFARFEDGVEAVRAIVQSGLRPANCRLIEADEARFTMAGDGSAHLLVLGFESPSLSVSEQLDAALQLCAAGEVDPPKAQSSGAWRSAFLRAPYVRDTFVAAGVLSETFETAITWERFGALRDAVVGAARRVLDDERARVTCRFTHAYPDGPAPYFTVLAPARRGEEPEQWWAVKRA